ncbi:hypothetical protein [Paenibacillus hexagrammi]|uniref:Lipoprotein n=1 Tax=Paenibacillus hexagrammi TaxID=2908839 RepID=A0ABY3SPX3_9BACL|nr:hypothetical protein [Paenibacillus sp. YPD9-1]UJF35116.1 hypothetical protein L0M14_08270 [Paenibacillus sp. YPD9-1]
MLNKWMTLTVITALSLTSLTGCTDNTKIKEAVELSLTKQKEMKSYSFDGSAALELSDAWMASPNPLTNGILGLFRECTINWKGASSAEPLQLETDINITPKGSTSPIAIPILIKDNKLYFNLPAINTSPDEYYAIDLQQMSQNSSSPLKLDNLKNTSELTTTLGTSMFQSIDPKWYSEAKEPVTLKDGTSARSITVDITDKNEKELNTSLQAKWPDMVSTLQNNGLLTAEKADKLKTMPSGLQVKAPGKLSVAIDDQGFIRDEVLDLQLSIPAADGKATDNKITLHQTYDGINQPPAFTKETPAHVKSFDDILKLLNKTKK